MNYHNITHDDMLNGDGLRVVLWVSGCNHGCKNCHNQITWDHEDGQEFDLAAKEEILQELDKDYVSGITFSGGDPFHEENVKEVFYLVNSIKELLPNKTIWLYTGYTWQEIVKPDLINHSTTYRRECLNYIDVLVDGRYIEDLKDSKLHWRGSSNQRVIDVQETLKIGSVVLHDE